MKTRIQSLFTKENIINVAGKIFSPSQRLTLINSIFVCFVIGFIGGTLLKGCAKSMDQKMKPNISTNR